MAIAVTSELMTTGVDAKTCKLVVLEQNIQSMTKFKQIIGRGTRIDERYNKLWFTILDFRKATELFADERFDGLPVKVITTTKDEVADPESDFDEQLEDEVSDGAGQTGHAEEASPDYPSGPSTETEPDGELPETDEERRRKFYVIGHYINHCIGYKCSEIIDARDLRGKCAEGRFICASCGSCCTKHQEKFGNVNKGETEQVKYDRLYRDSPFFSS